MPHFEHASHKHYHSHFLRHFLDAPSRPFQIVVFHSIIFYNMIRYCIYLHGSFLPCTFRQLAQTTILICSPSMCQLDSLCHDSAPGHYDNK